MSASDAIVIPGGGLLRNGEVPPWVTNRLDRALEIATGREYIITLSAATIYKPAVLDNRGIPIFESVAAARYLIGRGFNAARVLPETASYDTIGNAYFCRVIHTDPRGLRSLHVITSEFHMRRTEAIFNWVFALDPITPRYELTFEATANVGMERTALSARYEKERAGTADVLAKVQTYKTMADIHRFLFTEHGIYAPAMWPLAKHELTTGVL